MDYTLSSIYNWNTVGTLHLLKIQNGSFQHNEWLFSKEEIMTNRKVITAFLIIIVAVSLLAAQSATGDPRVKKTLERLGLNYQLSKSGNFNVTYNIEDTERTHMVTIMSKTETYRGIEIREIYAIAASLDDYPPEELIYRMMEENSTLKLGAWGMEASSDGVYIYFTTKIPADVKDNDLKYYSYFVAEIADELEEEILGTDDY